MPASYIIKKMLKQELNKLLNPVRLMLFFDNNDTIKSQGEKDNLLTLKMYEEYSNGKLIFEKYIINENKELAEKYHIDRVPTILFVDDKGNELIRYLAIPKGSEVKPFIQTIVILSGVKNYYKAAIRGIIGKIDSTTLKVMVTDSCAYCPELVIMASQFALASKGKIRAEIIDIMKNHDIGNKYNTQSVPYIVINDRNPIVGLYHPNDLLEEILKEN